MGDEASPSMRSASRSESTLSIISNKGRGRTALVALQWPMRRQVSWSRAGLQAWQAWPRRRRRGSRRTRAGRRRRAARMPPGPVYLVTATSLTAPGSRLARVAAARDAGTDTATLAAI